MTEDDFASGQWENILKNNFALASWYP